MSFACFFSFHQYITISSPALKQSTLVQSCHPSSSQHECWSSASCWWNCTPVRLWGKCFGKCNSSIDDNIISIYIYIYIYIYIFICIHILLYMSIHMRINERKYNIDSHEKERREYRCNYDLELFVFVSIFIVLIPLIK